MQELVFFYRIYFVTALTLFPATMLVVLVCRKPQLLCVEYVAWLVPGFTYWLLFQLMARDGSLPSKTLANGLLEPIIVAAAAWLVFLVRLFVALESPTSNRKAAWIAIGVSNLLVMFILAFTPTWSE